MRTWKIINEANGDICEFSSEELKHLMVYYDFNFTPQMLRNNKWEYILVDGSFYCNIEQYHGMVC
jgi:hypothetical protein